MDEILRAVYPRKEKEGKRRGERTASFPGGGWTGPGYLAGILIGLDHPVGGGPAVPILLLLAVAGLVGFVARAARRAALGGLEPPPAKVLL